MKQFQLNFQSRLIATIVVMLSICAVPTFGQTLEKGQLDQLKFRHIGPIGNRIVAVSGIAGNPLVYYVGAATGGIWKTVDGGLSWKPIFDDKPVHAIGALAVAPSDTEIVYAGTGEAFIRSNVSIGNGIWKSVDGGQSWEHMGLDNTGRISRIVVHPTNADIVYATAVGHGYSPQKDRGVFKSIDGGKTWKHVLFVDENTGSSDLAMNPSNPRILYAGMWQIALKTWNRTSGGPGSGIYKSIDAGETWKKVEDDGLPQGDIGKIALAIPAKQPDRIYALIETGDGVPYKGKPTESGELWRSDDAGKTWKLVNSNRDLGGRQAYYTRCAASPDNPNEVYFMWANFSTSIDGGVTATTAGDHDQPNWDHHEIWIDPTNGDRMIVVGDGGLSISQDRGKSWYRVQLPLAQVYHVTTDSKVPYNVLTNRQDGPSMKGPSRFEYNAFTEKGMIPTGKWYDIGGGESGFATPDPTDPDIIWSSASGYGPLGGIVTRFNEKSQQYRQVEVWPEMTVGHTAENLKYRFQWTFPLLISPHDNNKVYVTSQVVHRTTNKGQSWEVISPDLTLNDKSKQGFSGGLTGDNITVEYMNVIYAFEESPVTEGVFWAGTNDGLVHVSRDGGQNWTNVTANIPGLPKLGVVRNIDASHFDAGTAYMTIEFHQVGNFKPYVYKTNDFGASWQKITNGIDDFKLSYTRNIKSDPFKKGLLYLGTENKLYVSFNDGAQWQSLMGNLPATPMYWLDIPEHYNDLVIGTYGRGIWILDDISVLQQMAGNTNLGAVHLFDPKPAYRLRPVAAIMQFFREPSFGDNPPIGASINFWLKEKDDSVKVHILDMAGDTVRTMKHKGISGLNRVWWDIKSDKADPIVMRTSPLYVDWLKLGKERTRKSTLPPSAKLMPPGNYQVHLEVEDKSYNSTLEIMKDPNSEGSLSDIQAQFDLISNISMDLDRTVKVINEIEETRRQLYDIGAILKAKELHPDLRESIGQMDTLMIGIEHQLIQLKYTGHGQDAVRYPVKVAERLNYLMGVIEIADFPPTDEHFAVYDVLKKRLEGILASYQALKTGKLADLKTDMISKNVGPWIE